METLKWIDLFFDTLHSCLGVSFQMFARLLITRVFGALLSLGHNFVSAFDYFLSIYLSPLLFGG